MPIRKYKPVTSTQRYKSTRVAENISKENPPKHLLCSVNYNAGRSSSGRVSVWQKGGRHKRRYRIIDFKRDKLDVPGDVAGFYYDPNRSVDIALVKYNDGDYRFILAPEGLKIGSKVIAAEKAPIKPGNTMPLKNIPMGSIIHNLEFFPGKGAQLVRSAGSQAVIMGLDKSYVIIRLTSGEMRRFHKECRATIGQLANKEHNLLSLGKAGRSRWLGRRPHTRGVVMNPVDHPMGGGEGKSSGGRHPCTPWGKPTKGYRTRMKKKTSDKFIVQRRGAKRR